MMEIRRTALFFVFCSAFTLPLYGELHETRDGIQFDIAETVQPLKEYAAFRLRITNPTPQKVVLHGAIVLLDANRSEVARCRVYAALPGGEEMNLESHCLAEQFDAYLFQVEDLLFVEEKPATGDPETK